MAKTEKKEELKPEVKVEVSTEPTPVHAIRTGKKEKFGR